MGVGRVTLGWRQERWGRWQQKREPLAWEGWKRYKKTRQYQYLATIWGA
jgi:hypothetical protein